MVVMMVVVMIVTMGITSVAWIRIDSIGRAGRMVHVPVALVTLNMNSRAAIGRRTMMSLAPVRRGMMGGIMRRAMGSIGVIVRRVRPASRSIELDTVAGFGSEKPRKK